MAENKTYTLTLSEEFLGIIIAALGTVEAVAAKKALANLDMEAAQAALLAGDVLDFIEAFLVAEDAASQEPGDVESNGPRDAHF